MSGPPFSRGFQTGVGTRLTPLDANHVVAWECQDAPGANVLAESVVGGAANLAVTNAADVVQGAVGMLGSAVYLDGTANAQFTLAGGVALVNFPANMVAGWSIECWVKPDVGGNLALFGNVSQGLQENLAVRTQTGGSSWQGLARLAGANLLVQGSTSRQQGVTGSWHHVAMTYDGASLALFANGMQVGATAAAGNKLWTPAATAQWYVGASQGVLSPISGMVARCRLSNVARALAYWQAVYRKGMYY